MLVHKLKSQAHVKVGNMKIFNLGERTCEIGIDGPDKVEYPPSSAKDQAETPLLTDKDAYDVVG